MLPTSATTIDAAALAAIGQTTARLMNKLAVDRSYAAQVASAASSRNSALLKQLVRQAGVQASAATASSSTSGKDAILIIEITCCVGNPPTCYKVTVTIYR